jgi:hypothetical protein
MSQNVPSSTLLSDTSTPNFIPILDTPPPIPSSPAHGLRILAVISAIDHVCAIPRLRSNEVYAARKTFVVLLNKFNAVFGVSPEVLALVNSCQYEPHDTPEPSTRPAPAMACTSPPPPSSPPPLGPTSVAGFSRPLVATAIPTACPPPTLPVHDPTVPISSVPLPDLLAKYRELLAVPNVPRTAFTSACDHYHIPAASCVYSQLGVDWRAKINFPFDGLNFGTVGVGSSKSHASSQGFDSLIESLESFMSRNLSPTSDLISKAALAQLVFDACVGHHGIGAVPDLPALFDMLRKRGIRFRYQDVRALLCEYAGLSVRPDLAVEFDATFPAMANAAAQRVLPPSAVPLSEMLTLSNALIRQHPGDREVDYACGRLSAALERLQASPALLRDPPRYYLPYLEPVRTMLRARSLSSPLLC